MAGTPLDIPATIHYLLWPLLVLWAGVLVQLRAGHEWMQSMWLAIVVSAATLLADAAVIVAALTWRDPVAGTFIFTLVWVAAFFSITAWFVLRAPREDEGPGDVRVPREPEPPWWPDFERQYRAYVRRDRSPRPRARV